MKKFCAKFYLPIERAKVRNIYVYLVHFVLYSFAETLIIIFVVNVLPCFVMNISQIKYMSVFLLYSCQSFCCRADWTELKIKFDEEIWGSDEMRRKKTIRTEWMKNDKKTYHLKWKQSKFKIEYKMYLKCIYN